MCWWYVYILSSSKKGVIYIGSTNDLKRRLNQHNNGFCNSTKFGIPWKIKLSIAIRNEKKARKLEKYFKTGSGKALLYRRFF